MRITLLMYSRKGKPNRWESLCQYGFDVVEQREMQLVQGNGSAAVGALLIDQEEIAPREVSRLIAEMQAQRSCVLVVCDTTELTDDYLNAGADAVVSAIGNPAQTANAIRSACHHYHTRQQLCRQIETLKSKLERRRLIGHAMGLTGELLGIPEAEALRRLRHEARNQRRPLGEVAQVVIEAARLMSGTSRTRSRRGLSGSIDGGQPCRTTPVRSRP